MMVEKGVDKFMETFLHILDSYEVLDELTPIICITLICSCIHEYIFRTNEHYTFLTNKKIWISTFVTSIICFVLDPWIVDFNPRLALLPPLILGLSGMDLVNRLSTVKGNMTIIEYILSFVGIDRKDTSTDTNTQTTPQVNYDDLDNLLSIFLYLVSTLLAKYYTNKDPQLFLKKYYFIKKDFDLLNNEIIKYQAIPVTSTLVFSTIIKKVIELDSIYNNITCSPNSFTTSK